MKSGSSPARTVFVLVRHGQSRNNEELRFGGHGNTALTELGERQAQATAGFLATSGATAVISSDLTRARQTAEPIAHATGVDLTLDPGLRERSLGELNGLLFAEVEDRYPEEWRRLRSGDPTFRPPGGGETIDSVFERVSQSVDRAVATHAGGHVVVVSHALAIFHVFSHICGLGSPSAGHKVFLLVDNCSISTFVHTSGSWRIAAINDRSHLGELVLSEPYPV